MNQYPHWEVEGRRFSELRRARAWAEIVAEATGRHVHLFQHDDSTHPPFVLRRVDSAATRAISGGLSLYKSYKRLAEREGWPLPPQVGKYDAGINTLGMSQWLQYWKDKAQLQSLTERVLAFEEAIQ